MNELKEYIAYLSSILEMPAVELKAIREEELIALAGEDALACYDREMNCIYLSEKNEYTLEDYYHLSHEIRHAWQQYTNPDYYFQDYSEDMDEPAYHSSSAEIDANAFAAVAIAIAFAKVVRRTYKTDEEAALKYEARRKELMNEFGIIIA